MAEEKKLTAEERMEIRIAEFKEKLSESEKKMMEFMDQEEEKQYREAKIRMKDYEAKMKKKRDAAVRRQKAGGCLTQSELCE